MMGVVNVIVISTSSPALEPSPPGGVVATLRLFTTVLPTPKFEFSTVVENVSVPEFPARVAVPISTSEGELARDCSAKIRSGGRVDSRLLLPARGGCLIKMLPVEFRHDGRQKWEATELGDQTRIDPSDRGAVSHRGKSREEADPGRIRSGD